jgi:flagellar motor switch protein FliM
LRHTRSLAGAFPRTEERFLRDDSGGSFDQVMRLTQEHSAVRRYAMADRYDFKQTEKFSQDQNKFLERIYNSFSEHSITLLAPLLQTRVDLDLQPIKPQPYQKYLNSLPDPTMIVVFKVDAETQGLLSVEYELAFGLIDRLMGGRGVKLEEYRHFTDLERAILQRPVMRLLDAYSDAWRDVVAVKPIFQSMELNPLAVHIVPPSETMVVITFQAHIAQTSGMIEICLPFKHLKNIVPKASFDEFLVARQTASGVNLPPIHTKNLESAKVPLSVELGRAEVMFQDLLGLEVGDTIRLNTAIGEPLRIRVNEKTKFLGHPGTTRDGKMAAKLVRVLMEGDEEFEE